MKRIGGLICSAVIFVSYEIATHPHLEFCFEVSYFRAKRHLILSRILCVRIWGEWAKTVDNFVDSLF